MSHRNSFLMELLGLFERDCVSRCFHFSSQRPISVPVSSFSITLISLLVSSLLVIPARSTFCERFSGCCAPRLLSSLAHSHARRSRRDGQTGRQAGRCARRDRHRHDGRVATTRRVVSATSGVSRMCGARACCRVAHCSSLVTHPMADESSPPEPTDGACASTNAQLIDIDSSVYSRSSTAGRHEHVGMRYVSAAAPRDARTECRHRMQCTGDPPPPPALLFLTRVPFVLVLVADVTSPAVVPPVLLLSVLSAAPRRRILRTLRAVLPLDRRCTFINEEESLTCVMCYQVRTSTRALPYTWQWLAEVDW